MYEKQDFNQITLCISVREDFSYKVGALYIRKICFSPKNGAVSVSKIQSYFSI